MGLIPLIGTPAGFQSGMLVDLMKNPHVKGVRLMLDREPHGRLNRDVFAEVLYELDRPKLALDILARADQLQELSDLLRGLNHGRQKIVLNHLGCPPYGKDLRSWKRGMALLAGVKQIYVKTSLHFVEDNFLRNSANRCWFRGVLSQVLEWFGEHRMLFATDYPDAETEASYGEIIHAFHEWMQYERLSISQRSAILGGNALRVYGEPSNYIS